MGYEFLLKCLPVVLQVLRHFGFHQTQHDHRMKIHCSIGDYLFQPGFLANQDIGTPKMIHQEFSDEYDCCFPFVNLLFVAHKNTFHEPQHVLCIIREPQITLTLKFGLILTSNLLLPRWAAFFWHELEYDYVNDIINALRKSFHRPTAPSILFLS